MVGIPGNHAVDNHLFLAVNRGNKGNHKHESQSRFDIGEVKSQPARNPAQNQIVTVMLDVHGPENKGDQHTENTEQKEGVFNGRGGIENPDDQKTDGVIGHGQQKQIFHRRMTRAENQFGTEPGDGNVRCRNDTPAVNIFRAVEENNHQNIDNDRPHHTADGGHQRIQRFFNGIHGSAGPHRFGDFRHGNGKEDGHKHIFHKEVNGKFTAEKRKIHKGMVALGRDIGPYQRDNDTKNQGQRIGRCHR